MRRHIVKHICDATSDILSERGWEIEVVVFVDHDHEEVIGACLPVNADQFERSLIDQGHTVHLIDEAFVHVEGAWMFTGRYEIPAWV
jgi:hypothetical protein